MVPAQIQTQLENALRLAEDARTALEARVRELQQQSSASSTEIATLRRDLADRTERAETADRELAILRSRLQVC